MVGGAVLNKNYANMINADYYAKDAREAVKIAEKVYLKKIRKVYLFFYLGVGICYFLILPFLLYTEFHLIIIYSKLGSIPKF